MIIDVNQINSERKNQFEILINNKNEFFAQTPFLTINGGLGIENLRKIKIFDNSNNLIYKTNYSYLKNLTEEIVPFKYMFTNSQIFNKFCIINKNEEEVASIFYKMQEVFLGYYAISINNKQYNCYEIQDGYYVHVCIYDGDIQIGEIIKLQVVTDAKDKYKLFLKENYSNIKDYIICLILYLDMTNYNSSYIKFKGQSINYSKNYSKANKYYNKDWIKNNFDCEDFFSESEKLIKETKKNIKKGTMNILKIFLITWSIIIILTIILLLFLLT